MHEYLPQELCKHCGERFPQQRTGRPGEYCGTACRQAAHRKNKHKNHDTALTAQLDTQLVRCARNLEADVRRLVRALENPHTPDEEPLGVLVHLQNEVDKMLQGTVGRARRRSVSWARIGAVLNLSKDTARHKYGDVERIVQRITRAHRPGPPLAAAAVRRDPDRDDDPDGRLDPALCTPSVTLEPAVTGQLAPVLSHLQRASKLPLRVLGERIGLSASHLSRLLSGERFPDWDTTARFAHACGADPSVLRKVWENAEAHRLVKHRTQHRLDSALRYLHQRAGSPSTWSIAVASSGALDQDMITAVLDGTTVPDWEVVQRLVLVLDGEPSYFRPLWEAAEQRGEQPPPPPSQQPLAPARSRATARLEDLFTAFGGALRSSSLAASAPSPPPASQSALSFLRPHPAPAPIPALGHWATALPT